MAELQKDFLFVLIKSLSTSEKRQFKLYVNRLGINVDAKFLLLFNELDKMNEYQEEIIIQKKFLPNNNFLTSKHIFTSKFW